MAKATLEERFWSKVDRRGSDECWPWTGAHVPAGYGSFGYPGRPQVGAHRVAYELVIGPIPAGKQLDHLCRNRGCVNPAHLEPVTIRENLLRGETLAAANAAKTHCPQGHPLSGDNLVISVRNGARGCLTCKRKANREFARRTRLLLPPKPRKSHCPQGHPYDEANTYWYIKDGYRARGCRECSRQRSRLYQRRLRQARQK